ncbi:RICIN domain-containing protein [Streptomyces sp. NPDC046465]|uniref:RICIN domain-containing protein n=1 Tax=Streptomyces sp. NPDC046465 TaxID=3155810 RepID=UPI0033E6C3D7
MKRRVVRTARAAVTLAAVALPMALPQATAIAAADPGGVAPSVAATEPAGWTPVKGAELARLTANNEIWSNWHSGKCLEIYGDSDANGGGAVQWSCHRGPNQRWNTKIVNGRYFEFRNGHSGKCLEIRGDSKADGASASQWSCNGSHTQHWTVYSSDTNPKFYKLTNRNSGKCLEVLSWRGEDGAALGQWSCHDGNNQRWSRE